jgi:hypothetical protein
MFEDRGILMELSLDSNKKPQIQLKLINGSDHYQHAMGFWEHMAFLTRDLLN